MAQNVHACKIERFRFFWRKAVKHGKDSEFQKSLAPFWKQSIDKHLCQMCALSSYQFLRSILKKERRTWFEKPPIFCTFLRRNPTQLYNFDGFYYQLRGWSWILSNSSHQQIHLRLNLIMAKIGVVRKLVIDLFWLWRSRKDGPLSLFCFLMHFYPQRSLQK